MRLSLAVVCCLFVASASAQWVVYPIHREAPGNHSPQKTTQIKTASRAPRVITRADSVGDSTHIPPPYLTPHGLPFFDDFSRSNVANYADTNKWQYGNAVTWNFGLGKNPPSLGIVSFDGLDSLDNPYDLTNNLDKGFGDRLTSWTFKFDSLPENQKDSLYLSFYFQYQGNGEPPDPGDHLLVEFRAFKKDSLDWITVAQIDVDRKLIRNVGATQDSLALTDSLFYPVIIKIPRQNNDTDPLYLHDQFQFRISSFGRISGPWDTWNVDYVYLNTHRYANDISFPDRTIYAPITSLFGDYWSIPATHFHADSSNLIKRPVFAVTNLRQDQTGALGQVVTYNSNISIHEWKQGVATAAKTIPLDVNQEIDTVTVGSTVVANQHKIVKLHTLPKRSDFTKDSDSVVFSLQVQLLSGDNIPVAGLKGDYSPKYSPIDFRVNDTTLITQRLADYYAYDDGTAEFAAGLNQPGTEVAYRYDMVQKAADFVLGVDFYFPNVGDQSAQSITLVIRKDTTNSGIAYSEFIPLKRSTFNKFVRHMLPRGIRVQDHFYIGYKQTSTAVIALGLDTSHDTADKIFFNVQGTWETPLSTELQGSLMIRPILGFAVFVGLDDEPVALDAWPNPTTGTLYLSKAPDQIEVFDFFGRKLNYVADSSGEHLRINLVNATPGIYILKASLDGKIVTRKVLVQR